MQITTPVAITGNINVLNMKMIKAVTENVLL